MNVHIIRDEHCPLAVYQNVFDKLSKSAGLIRFIKSKDDALIQDDTDDMFIERERKPMNKNVYREEKKNYTYETN